MLYQSRISNFYRKIVVLVILPGFFLNIPFGGNKLFAADLNEVMQRLEMLEANNKKMALEIENLKAKNRRLEGEKVANINSHVPKLQPKIIKNIKTTIHEEKYAEITLSPNTLGPKEGANWTGFYGGLNVGYGWGIASTAYTSSSPVVDNYNNFLNYNRPSYIITYPAVYGATALTNAGNVPLNQNGVLGGIQVGYNRNFDKTFVLGIEADIQGASISASGQYAGLPVNQIVNWENTQGGGTSPLSNRANYLGGGSVQTDINWIGTLRGRLGYLLVPNILIFGTGGLAYANIKGSSQNYFVASGSILDLDTPANNSYYNAASTTGTAAISTLRTGWTAGMGAEWLFRRDLSLKAEALYYDLGDVNLRSNSFGIAGINNSNSVIGPSANISTSQISYSGVMARMGVNYHFDSGK